MTHVKAIPDTLMEMAPLSWLVQDNLTSTCLKWAAQHTPGKLHNSAQHMPLSHT